MRKRRGFKQVTLQDRLSKWAKAVREQADKLPPGPDRDALLTKARQAEIESRLKDWVKSLGSRPSK